MGQAKALAIFFSEHADIVGLHFLPGSVKGAVRLLDAMVDDQMVDREVVGIEVQYNAFRLLDAEGLGDGDDDIFSEALISDEGSDVIGELLPSRNDFQEGFLSFL